MPLALASHRPATTDYLQSIYTFNVADDNSEAPYDSFIDNNYYKNIGTSTNLEHENRKNVMHWHKTQKIDSKNVKEEQDLAELGEELTK